MKRQKSNPSSKALADWLMQNLDGFSKDSVYRGKARIVKINNGDDGIYYVEIVPLDNRVDLGSGKGHKHRIGF